jgi:hypothetical protein
MSVARAEVAKQRPKPKKSSEGRRFLDYEAKLSDDEFRDGVSSDESGSSEPAVYEASFVDDCTQRVKHLNNFSIFYSNTVIIYNFLIFYVPGSSFYGVKFSYCVIIIIILIKCYRVERYCVITMTALSLKR